MRVRREVVTPGLSTVRVGGFISIKMTLLFREEHKPSLDNQNNLLCNISNHWSAVTLVPPASSFSSIFPCRTLLSHQVKVFTFFSPFVTAVLKYASTETGLLTGKDIDLCLLVLSHEALK